MQVKLRPAKGARKFKISHRLPAPSGGLVRGVSVLAHRCALLVLVFILLVPQFSAVSQARQDLPDSLNVRITPEPNPDIAHISYRRCRYLFCRDIPLHRHQTHS
jgi:hypothetical protein